MFVFATCLKEMLSDLSGQSGMNPEQLLDEAGDLAGLLREAVGNPYSAAVAAVMGPIEAMATRPRHAWRSSSLNASAKLRAVDELVNVTTSTAPAARVSASRGAPPPSALRVT